MNSIGSDKSLTARSVYRTDIEGVRLIPHFVVDFEPLFGVTEGRELESTVSVESFVSQPWFDVEGERMNSCETMHVHHSQSDYFAGMGLGNIVVRSATA